MQEKESKIQHLSWSKEEPIKNGTQKNSSCAKKKDVLPLMNTRVALQVRKVAIGERRVTLKERNSEEGAEGRAEERRLFAEQQRAHLNLIKSFL